MPEPVEIRHPPLPALRWRGFAWEGEIRLPTWAGFQSRRGRFTSLSDARPSDGRVGLYVEPGGIAADGGDLDAAAPSAEQVAAFRHLKSRERAVTGAVLRSILEEYPEFREIYLGPKALDLAGVMPPVASAEELRPLIGLGYVHILSVASGGVAYVGFELGCTWDEVHGLGVLTHRDRVVDIGAAETAYLDWIADRDRERDRDRPDGPRPPRGVPPSGKGRPPGP